MKSIGQKKNGGRPLFSAWVFVSAAFALLTAIFFLCWKSLYSRKDLQLEFEPDYYWSERSAATESWDFHASFAGYEYFLYIPPEYRVDRHNPDLKVPLYVVFHGSDNKGISLGRYGRMFASEKIQSLKKSAVLVLLSRGGYYSDCHDTSMQIQNILMRNECIDKTNIIAYGHSQGAMYVVKLACFEPALFRGVISGSGFYQIKISELLKVLPVQFYYGISKNDKGIYEQGEATGKLLAKFCRNSVYAEYESRGHFYVEPQDVSPTDGTVFLEWLDKVVNGK